MKSRLLGVLIAFTIPFISLPSKAALVTNAFLNFDSGTPDPSGDSEALPISGSYFVMEVTLLRTVYTVISQYDPIKLGVIQPASGSHIGLPSGTESPGIDNPWVLDGNTGMHGTTDPITVISDDNNGNVTLDFAGWGYDWFGIPFISLGGSPEFPNFIDTGIATMTCTSTCENGDAFVLDYSAHVYDLPIYGNSGWNSVPYTLHLEGTISSVPVPAAVWLFGSGLLGIIDIARRKNAA